MTCVDVGEVQYIDSLCFCVNYQVDRHVLVSSISSISSSLMSQYSGTFFVVPSSGEVGLPQMVELFSFGIRSVHLVGGRACGRSSLTLQWRVRFFWGLQFQIPFFFEHLERFCFGENGMSVLGGKF